MNIGHETEVLEYKKTTAERKEAMNDVCAIINKHGKGTLYFGVHPNGEIIGQQISSNSLNDVATVFKEAIKPMIYPIIEEVVLDNKTLIKVSFEGNERPYSSYGKYYKRVFDRTEEMTPMELKSVIFSTDYSSKWENNKTKYTVNDIDKIVLRKFYNKSIECGRLEPLEEYSEQELLIGLGLLEDGYLTNAGYYLFSNKN